ncbi:MAG: TonB-dependent receptor [Chryseotalea sp. WA131a]|nr:MAG: TonB-dependent receptor [Chryseotalea sp. WA131a]
MTKLYFKTVVPLILMLIGTANLLAQSTISGTVTDGGTKEILAGVNIVVKGKVIGTISNSNGEYSLKVNQEPPFTLVFSFIGFRSQEIEIKDANTTGLNVTLEEETLLGQEVVVAASRVEESILKSPVTIEKMDILAIKQSAAPDFYDALANVKGVQTASGSLNFTAINTRGFASIANTRFVQWVDGMDTQAPLLNFPTGSIMGVGELDAESMELIPGAASALYGPNAFNGILIMNSKSPFDYQGLSAQVKAGVTSSTAAGTDPMTQYSVRYAKAFNNKFAFKVGASLLQAKDWLGNDYRTDRMNTASTVDLSGKSNFDGLNLYGDENQINLAALALLPNLPTVTRTGFREQDLVDNRDAKTLKLDGSLHYRITDKIEVSYTYRYGGGSSIYQGAEKYALRDFNQQFHKIEFKGDNFFLRGYQSATDAGKSYNLTALGTFMNETYSPTRTEWVPSFISAFQGSVPGVPAADVNEARAFADRNRPTPGTPEFTNLVDLVKANFFQKTPTGTFPGVQDGIARIAGGGGSFFDNSKLNHIEGNYKFFNQIKWAEIQIGGNFRQYDLFSNGTIFNEAPADGVNFSRVVINEFGGYAQIAKTFAEKLKITGSLRYDKNENFNGQLSPRLSAVYELDKNNNLRASFQTGFRNPDTQAQFIFFPTAGPTLLGSAEKNAGRYGVHNGGSWTQSSYAAYIASGGSIATGAPVGGNTSLLVEANVPYVQPEQLRSFELGYKGLAFSKLLIDLNGYYTSYTNFLGSQIVAAKLPTTHQGVVSAPGRLFSLYNNSPQEIKSYGVGLGLTYSLPKNFIVNGNYNWADLDAEETAEFNAGFNTPNNRFSVGIGNRKVAKNLGFNVNYRWQEDFIWVSSFGNNLPAVIPSFGVLDAQLNYKVSAIKSMIKVGATNLGGGDYRTNLGSPFVGQQYYISITFDEFLN